MKLFQFVAISAAIIAGLTAVIQASDSHDHEGHDHGTETHDHAGHDHGSESPNRTPPLPATPNPPPPGKSVPNSRPLEGNYSPNVQSPTPAPPPSSVPSTATDSIRSLGESNPEAAPPGRANPPASIKPSLLPTESPDERQIAPQEQQLSPPYPDGRSWGQCPSIERPYYCPRQFSNRHEQAHSYDDDSPRDCLSGWERSTRQAPFSNDVHGISSIQNEHRCWQSQRSNRISGHSASYHEVGDDSLLPYASHGHQFSPFDATPCPFAIGNSEMNSMGWIPR